MIFCNTRHGRLELRPVDRTVVLECPDCRLELALDDDQYRGAAPLDHRCAGGHAGAPADLEAAVAVAGGWRTV